MVLEAEPENAYIQVSHSEEKKDRLLFHRKTASFRWMAGQFSNLPFPESRR